MGQIGKDLSAEQNVKTAQNVQTVTEPPPPQGTAPSIFKMVLGREPHLLANPVGGGLGVFVIGGGCVSG